MFPYFVFCSERKRRLFIADNKFKCDLNFFQSLSNEINERTNELMNQKDTFVRGAFHLSRK